MSAQRFSIGKQFVWQDVIYEVRRLLPGSRVNIENVQTTETQVIPFTELAQALFAGELRFIQPGKLENQTAVGIEANLSDYPPHLRALAEYRLDVIRPLLALNSSKRTKATVAARVAEMKEAQQVGKAFPKMSISVASIYRWIKDYTESGYDIRALVGNSQRQGGQQQSRLEEEVETIIQAVVRDRYYVSEKVTSEDIYLEVLLRIKEENRFRHAREKLTAPSKVTVWRRIDALDEIGKLIAKRGKRAAKRHLTQYGKTEYPTDPLERAEIDHTRMDIIVVDGNDNLPLGRPTITYCLDTATRYPLGFYIGFDPPSYLTVMECLHHTILPKEDMHEKYGTQHNWIACGIPTALIVDNGKEFIGVDLQDACNSLGIQLHQMPVAMPHFKAAVERMFETLNTGVLHTLPGTTFSNPQQRGDYESESEACINLEDLDRIFHLFLLDVYAEKFHRGLDGIPARRWEASTQGGFFPRLPASAEELKVLLGRVAYRTLRPGGVEFLSLRYNSQDLAPLRTCLNGEKAKLKYDPTDLGCIYIYDPQGQAYIEVECLDKEYAQGLSLWKHRVIRNLARQEQDKVDVLGLARAKRRIQEIVEESKANKKIKSRSRIARWETGGKPAGRAAEDAPSTPNGTTSSARSPLPESRSDSSTSTLDFSVNLEELESEGWSAGYDLPITNHRDDVG